MHAKTKNKIPYANNTFTNVHEVEDAGNDYKEDLILPQTVDVKSISHITQDANKINNQSSQMITTKTELKMQASARSRFRSTDDFPDESLNQENGLRSERPNIYGLDNPVSTKEHTNGGDKWFM